MSTTEQQVPYPHAVEKFPRLRQSLLGSFDRCGLTTKFGMEQHGFTSHDQARGQIFHRVAAKCLEDMAMMGEEKIETDVAIAILEETLRQHDVNQECVKCAAPAAPHEGRIRCSECGYTWESDVVNLPVEHVKDLRISVIKWAHDNTFSIENLVGTEEPLESVIAYPSDYGPVERTITGRLDALFFDGDRAIVPDWKDTWALPPASGVSFGGFFQQRFYGLLVLANHPGVRSVTLREVYHRWNDRREATLHRDDLPDVEAEISALVERFDRAVEEDVWRPSPGKHCSWCTRPEACPIFPTARGEGAVKDAEMAKRYAAEAAVARAVLDQRMKALKAWSNRHGDVPASDAKGRAVYGYVEREKTTRPDKEQLERELREHGVHGIDLDSLYKRRKETHYVIRQDGNGEVRPADARMEEMLRESLEKIDKKKEEK